MLSCCYFCDFGQREADAYNGIERILEFFLSVSLRGSGILPLWAEGSRESLRWQGFHDDNGSAGEETAPGGERTGGLVPTLLHARLL